MENCLVLDDEQFTTLLLFPKRGKQIICCCIYNVFLDDTTPLVQMQKHLKAVHPGTEVDAEKLELFFKDASKLATSNSPMQGAGVVWRGSARA
jgi:hypothetical protein